MPATDKLLLLIEEIAESDAGLDDRRRSEATVAVRLAEAHAWLTAPNQTHAGRSAAGQSQSKDADGRLAVDCCSVGASCRTDTMSAQARPPVANPTEGTGREDVPA